MLQLFKGSKFDWMKYRKVFGVMSIIMVISAIGLFIQKGLVYGVDFRGGAEIQVKLESDITSSQLRDALGSSEFQGVEVQSIGDATTGDLEYLIKVANTEADLNATAKKVEDTLKNTFKDSGLEILRVDIVGPKAGEQLRLSGIQALFWAILAIFIYVALRFDPRFAPGAVMALMHDALFVIFVWTILGKDFTLQTVAAMLAVIGYSVNDTVVIYDRIREELGLNPDMKIVTVINKALNETLGRTIMTTITTLMVVVSLFVLGGDIIKDFALALIVGNIAGVYSTVYVASNVTIITDKYFKNRKKKASSDSRGAVPSH